MIQMKEAALSYASKGWPIFPCNGKDPLTPHGFKDASTDPEQIDAWWNKWPHANIGLDCGGAEIVAIDIDPRNDGMTSWELLRQQYQDIPKTATSCTGGGGYHLLYSVPQGIDPKSLKVKLCQGIDVKRMGGYIILPPSVHPDTGKTYKWGNGRGPDALSPVPLPEPFVKLLTRMDTDPSTTATSEHEPLSTNDEIEKAREALKNLTPSRCDDYAEWIQVGLSLRALGDAGLVIWDEWSKGSTHYHDGACNKHWSTFPATPKITLQSLYYWAQEDQPGWKSPFSTNGHNSGEVPEPEFPSDESTLAENPVTNDILLKANLSSEGNAECLVLLYGNKLRYDHTRLTWLIWNGEIWEIASEGQAERLTVATVRERYRAGANLPGTTEEQIAYKKRFAGYMVNSENARNIKQVLESANTMPGIATKAEQWDADPWAVNAGAVTIDLKEVKTRSNRKEDYITKHLGTVFDPSAACPRWILFLNEVFHGDAELIAYIQRAIGYSLTGDVSEQAFFLCIGKGSNGKSVLFNIIGKLLGDYAGSTDFVTFDADTAEARGDLAKLKGTHLVTIIETDEDKHLAEARIKAITGKDRVITARALYERPFDYHVTFKLWLAMNHPPVVRGTDKGIWRRIQRIDFTETFENSRDDKTLEDKLVQELPGILNWALIGLKQWHSQRLSPAQSVRTVTNKYRDDSNMVGQWLDECTATGEKMEMKFKDGYKSFELWCRDHGIKNVPSHKSWVNGMSDKNYDNVVRRNYGYVFIGIGLLESS